MRYLLFAVLTLGAFAGTTFSAQAQINKTYTQFTKDAEFEKAVLAMDMTAFLDKPATITLDTNVVTVAINNFNNEFKKRLNLPKKYVIRKAASTNFGYTISYGVYALNKKGGEEDAVYYIVFNLDFETGKIKDVEIQPNS